MCPGRVHSHISVSSSFSQFLDLKYKYYYCYYITTTNARTGVLLLTVLKRVDAGPILNVIITRTILTSTGLAITENMGCMLLYKYVSM